MKFENLMDLYDEYKDYELDYVIDKTIVAKSLNLVAADGGVGKTTICLQMAHAIQKGCFFFGYLCQKKNVLWINNEMERGFLVHRTKSTGIAPFSILNFDFTIDDENCIKELAKNAVNDGFEVIFIDSLVASISHLDENDNVGMGMMLKTIKKILCNEYGLTVVIIHHLGKAFNNQFFDVNRIRGASAIKDQCDDVFMLNTYKDGSRAIKNVKSKRNNDFMLRLQMEDGRFVDFNSEDGNVFEEKISTEDLIIDLLKERGQLKQIEICEIIKKDKMSVLKCLNRSEGLLWNKEKVGKAFVYSLMENENE